MKTSFKEIQFDDIVIDKLGSWTQVCDKCIKNHLLEVWDEIPSDGFICGVKGCSNIANYYLDFNYEK